MSPQEPELTSISQAKNIVNYLRIIHRILKPGGIWINLGELASLALRSSSRHTGPLLWHFENNTTNDVSIELDVNEMKQLLDNIGFGITVSAASKSCACHESIFVAVPADGLDHLRFQLGRDAVICIFCRVLDCEEKECLSVAIA